MDILKQCAAPIVAASIARTGFTIAYGISPDGPLHGLGSIRMDGVSFVNIPTSGERYKGNYKTPRTHPLSASRSRSTCVARYLPFAGLMKFWKTLMYTTKSTL